MAVPRDQLKLLLHIIMASPFNIYSNFADMLLLQTEQGKEESDNSSSDEEGATKTAVDFVDRLVKAMMTNCTSSNTNNKSVILPRNTRRITYASSQRRDESMALVL